LPDPGLLAALIGGLVILTLAGDFLVTGAVAAARRMGVSPLVAGILIVGFGTSAPEMVVALDASLQGDPGLALGNVVGSNIANIWLVLAAPALLTPFVVKQFGLRRSYYFMLLATIVWIAWAAHYPLTPAFGFALLAALVVYAVLMVWVTARAARKGIDVGLDDDELPGKFKMFASLVVGIVGLPLGAHLIVEGGVGIARTYDVPEEIIGLTLLAVGTSLPELGAGIAAAFRRRADVIIGNVIGSNIFNLLGAGAVIAMFGPITPADTFIQYDHWAMLAAAVTLGLFVVPKGKITRLAALALGLVYGIYLYGLVNGWNLAGEVERLIGG